MTVRVCPRVLTVTDHILSSDTPVDPDNQGNKQVELGAFLWDTESANWSA
jgi:hypothetical protein